MIKTKLKWIFSIVGASLAIVTATVYLIMGIMAVLNISETEDAKTIVYLLFAFLMYFALAFGFAFFGAKVLFSFFNREDDDQPFSSLVLCFSAFQLLTSFLSLIFFGGNAGMWLILIFSFASVITLLLQVKGLKRTWLTVLVGDILAMITAMTVACAYGGAQRVSAIFVAIICFLIGATFALNLIKE